MMNRFTLTLAAAASALTFATAAFAGPQYIDRTGYAASGYDVVGYFSLTQVPVGQTQARPVPGNADITAEYNGAKFAFSSTENRDTFLANPAKYAPQYDGHCAYGVAQGNKVPANPNLWRIVDGKLYLNITVDIEDYWEDNIPGNLKKSERNWVSLERRRASRDRIPQFKSSAPEK